MPSIHEDNIERGPGIRRYESGKRFVGIALHENNFTIRIGFVFFQLDFDIRYNRIGTLRRLFFEMHIFIAAFDPKMKLSPVVRDKIDLTQEDIYRAIAEAKSVQEIASTTPTAEGAPAEAGPKEVAGTLRYCTDMTNRAAAGEFDKMIGREEELMQMLGDLGLQPSEEDVYPVLRRWRCRILGPHEWLPIYELVPESGALVEDGVVCLICRKEMG